MFRKLLNVGKGHSIDKLQQQQHNSSLISSNSHQQQQRQAKNQFQLNEIKSYGFSGLSCLGYSSSLSLLAVGTKGGLVRVLGNPSVEFSYQLEPANQIRQIEFIDCRAQEKLASKQHAKTKQQNNNKKNNNNQQNNINDKENDSTTCNKNETNVSSKLIVLTDNGQLHMLELKTVKRQHYADNTTQTDPSATNECCQQNSQKLNESEGSQSSAALEFTELAYVGHVDFFKTRLDGDDRSKRVTTLEISGDDQIIYVGTEGANAYLVPITKFYLKEEDQQGTDHQLSQFQAVNEDDDALFKDANNTLPSQQEDNNKQQDEVDLNLNVEQQQVDDVDLHMNDIDGNKQAIGPFEMVNFEEDVAGKLGDDIKLKKPGAIESLKKHPVSCSKLLISYHRGLSIVYDLSNKNVDQYFYHNQVLESSCFASPTGDIFYTSHNDGSYIKWDCRQGSQAKANEDFISQLYGPYPCKPTPKIQACTGLANDQLEEMIVFSGGMPRATYDDKNPVTIVRIEPDGKDTIKTVLDFTSKVLDFVIITKPRGSLSNTLRGGQSSGGASGGGGGKKNKQKQQQQQQRNAPVAVALAILAEEEFVVIDLLNSEEYHEFALPYLNCVHSSAITCNQHYSEISDHLYEQLLAYNKQQLAGKVSSNEWPIIGGKVIEAPESKSHDILLTGHEDGSVNIWDVSNLNMRHLIHLSTSRYFATNEDELAQAEPDKPPIEGDSPADNEVNRSANNNEKDVAAEAWPPLKKVGRFDPYSDDTRLAIRRLTLCPSTGTMVVAGSGGQVLVFELTDEPNEISALTLNEVTIVSDQRFVWKGHDKLNPRAGKQKQTQGYNLISSIQLNPPVAATSIDLRSDWRLFALGTSYGFLLYDYENHNSVVSKCTLNVNDFAIITGDAPGTMSRKKSFRKSLRESFRRLRRGRSQRHQTQGGTDQISAPKVGFSRPTTGVRTLNSINSTSSPPAPPTELAHRNIFPGERHVEAKVELSSIVRCISLTQAVITANQPYTFTPSLWVGTNSGQVLVYSISLGNELGSTESSQATSTSESDLKQTKSAKLAKEIQLKHRAPIIAIFTSPEAPQSASSEESINTSLQKSSSFESGRSSSVDRKSPEPNESVGTSNQQQGVQVLASNSKMSKTLEQQPRVLICSEEQFKVFNLPNLKPFCKFKLTASEGLRAKKISITQFKKTVNPKNIISGRDQIKASKSLQSFATQTSRPSTPSQTINQDQSESSNAQKGNESNNNSPMTLNNNNITNEQHQTTSNKELLSSKFGAKTSQAQGTSTQISPNISSTEFNESDSIECETVFEPYMVCMSNQGDCAIYSVPDLKRQAQIQVCRREDVNGITSTMLTNYGEGYYLRSSSNFLRFSISNQRVPRVLSVV